MSFPYTILIIHIMIDYDVYFSIDASVHLGRSHFFNRKILKKKMKYG